MATISEDYVSFETAKLLKEKGFSELTTKAYPYFEGKDYKYDISCPTLQMAMKWLREIHHYIIEIQYGNVGSPKEPEMQWWWELENKQGEFLEGNIIDGNTTYEEACEEAIKYCLENLI